MKALIQLLFFSFAFINTAFANQYLTPGTGVKYTLDDLVTNSSGRVTFSGGSYFINDTVSINTNDTLTIYNDATVRFMPSTFLGVRKNGVLLVNPPNNVTFTANNTTTGYLGVKLDTSNSSVIRKLVFEYAVSFRINDCNPKLEQCIFRYNNNLASTTFGNGAIALFRASPIIESCSFINNKRAAIQGGANIANAPKIYNSYFYANSTSNANVPQINLGATSASGQDTVKIIGNMIYGGYTMSGGIGFLPLGNAYVVIKHNTIRKNRYGITLSGGSNINAVISYNIIDTNNIQNDPNLGGSGISFSGGTATSQQNSIVTGNIFRANLWGITILNRSRPNLGDLSNADTTDDGKNQFINNTNNNTPFTDVYNNSVDVIKAENNFWNTHDAAVAEQRIFHQADNPLLGMIDYLPIANASVKLFRFDAALMNNFVTLDWQSFTDENILHYNVQRSIDGTTFHVIGSELTTNNPDASSRYLWGDDISGVNANAVYYRMQIIEKDGKTAYSQVRKLMLNNGVIYSIVPNPARNQISVAGEGKVTIRIMNIAGRQMFSKAVELPVYDLNVSVLNAGVYIINIIDVNGKSVSHRLVKQ